MFELKTETEVDDRKVPTDFSTSRDKALVNLQKDRRRNTKRDLDLIGLGDHEKFAKEIRQLSWEEAINITVCNDYL